jgi:diguanylate cyclase (GGDEF)-like protein
MPEFLPSSYNTNLVTLSFLVAVFASYVALDLARRVRESTGKAARIWLICGSLAMGSGIWSMHFVAMMAFSLPIPLGYDWIITFLSWIAAVSVSGIALYIASHKQLRSRQLMLGGLTMGTGISLMHYVGMLAMRMEPAIQWNPWLFILSIIIAIVASFAALYIFFWMRTHPPQQVLAWQIAASLVMGAAIFSMHYTGMAAAQFPLGSICRAAYGFGTNWIGYAVGTVTFGLLAAILVTSLLDTRLQAHIAALNKSLETANIELLQNAFHDPLTKLPNRLILEGQLEHMAAQVDRAGGQLAILMINLDGFKLINDTLGYQTGDEVLKQVAIILQNESRTSDTIARVGGDDFVVVADTEGQPNIAATLAQRIIAAIGRPIRINGKDISLSCSIGICLYPGDGTAEKLLANADAAMSESKRSGKSTFRFYAPDMNADVYQQLLLQSDLKAAIESDDLMLYYQPKVDSATQKMLGVEALLRWRHPQRGFISPAEFIPVAEHCGLIIPLGNWVIRAAIRQAAEWRIAGMAVPVAINLSAYQLIRSDFLPNIVRTLEEFQVPPELVMLEITESVAMQHAAATLELMQRLNEIGIKLSIDDFGTGYSSLSYLRRFTVSQLKIDRSFILDLALSEDARAIVGGIIKLAHALGLRVVAEGVENQAQYLYLKALECDEIQGYFFSRPLPARSISSKMLSLPYPSWELIASSDAGA